MHEMKKKQCKTKSLFGMKSYTWEKGVRSFKFSNSVVYNCGSKTFPSCITFTLWRVPWRRDASVPDSQAPAKKDQTSFLDPPTFKI